MRRQPCAGPWGVQLFMLGQCLRPGPRSKLPQGLAATPQGRFENALNIKVPIGLPGVPGPGIQPPVPLALL
jgi:hypothetical protein